jgi:Mg2+/Co2+ transporter CorB
MKTFLPAFPLIRVLGAPILAVSRRLLAREEQREEQEEDREASEEEIETFIDEATEEGIIDKGEDELLRSVVEFGDKVVREVMTPRETMVCIRRDATIDNLKDLIIKEKYSRVPVNCWANACCPIAADDARTTASAMPDGRMPVWPQVLRYWSMKSPSLTESGFLW